MTTQRRSQIPMRRSHTLLMLLLLLMMRSRTRVLPDEIPGTGAAAEIPDTGAKGYYPRDWLSKEQFSANQSFVKIYLDLFKVGISQYALVGVLLVINIELLI